MECKFEGYSNDEIESAKGKIKLLEIRRKAFEILKEKLEKQFNFEITNYIIDDILDFETYHHTCLMINLATINNRISIENGERLKIGLKELFKIENRYDRLNRDIYLGNTFNFDKWYEKYSTTKVVNFKKYLSKEDFVLLKELKIDVKNKLYTEQEFDLVNMNLLVYYKSQDENEESSNADKKLPQTVKQEDYNKLLEKFNNISKECDF